MRRIIQDPNIRMDARETHSCCYLRVTFNPESIIASSTQQSAGPAPSIAADQSPLCICLPSLTIRSSSNVTASSSDTMKAAVNPVTSSILNRGIPTLAMTTNCSPREYHRDSLGADHVHKQQKLSQHVLFSCFAIITHDFRKSTFANHQTNSLTTS
jgi:hypothetical protein